MLLHYCIGEFRTIAGMTGNISHFDRPLDHCSDHEYLPNAIYGYHPLTP